MTLAIACTHCKRIWEIGLAPLTHKPLRSSGDRRRWFILIIKYIYIHVCVCVYATNYDNNGLSHSSNNVVVNKTRWVHTHTHTHTHIVYILYSLLVYETHRWDLDLGPDDACPLPYIILYKCVLLNESR